MTSEWTGTEHRIVVKQWSWSDYRPTCPCGWVGSHCSTKLQAQHEGAQHEGWRP